MCTLQHLQPHLPVVAQPGGEGFLLGGDQNRVGLRGIEAVAAQGEGEGQARAHSRGYAAG